jgi:hypothetical protein
MVGKKLGVFLDFDEDTACMVRFDVARLKILSTTWACIDVVLKVEVEGVTFDVWVVEEREKKRLIMVYEEWEDEGSRVVPVEVSDGGDDASGEGASDSGEDEESGAEVDIDKSVKVVQGEGHEVDKKGSDSSQLPNEERDSLPGAKSTNCAIMNQEIHSASYEVVGNIDEVCRPEGVVLESSVRVTDIDEYGMSGPRNKKG